MHNKKKVRLFSDAGEFEELVKKLPDAKLLQNMGLQLQSIDFEKDNENNFHMDFITAASNLRAANYGITPTDKFETKRIVGKIIPAIATTTSLVVGLVCLELLKILTGQTNLKNYKNWFCRISSYFIQRSDVKQPKKLKWKELEFTIWDHFTFEENVTLEHLIEKLKVEHKVDAEAIYYGTSSLLSFLTPDNERKERLKMKVSEVIERIVGPLSPHIHSVLLDIHPPSDIDQDIGQLPSVKVKLV